MNAGLVLQRDTILEMRKRSKIVDLPSLTQWEQDSRSRPAQSKIESVNKLYEQHIDNPDRLEAGSWRSLQQ